MWPYISPCYSLSNLLMEAELVILQNAKEAECKSLKQLCGLGYPDLTLPATLLHPMTMTKEEEQHLWHGQEIKIGFDPGLGCPPYDM